MGTDTLNRHRVVIIGGGFGGLYAAKNLRDPRLDVTLIDKRNFHLFQPLLYQVAAGGVSPGDISSPLRAILKGHKNTRVWQAECVDIDTDQRRIILRDASVSYDTLVVATGVSHHYFGNDAWATSAPGLKSVEDALHMRRRIFLAFETAEREPDADRRKTCMRFVVVGGGPTGVELAGTLAELAQGTLKDDFERIDTRESQIYLIEGRDRVLPAYPADLSSRAEQSLNRLGVEVQKETIVTDINNTRVTLKCGDDIHYIDAGTVLWAAGVKASPLGELLARKTGVDLDNAGRILVEPDLSIAGYPGIFVIGDLAHFSHQGGELPGVAPVAMQQGRFVSTVIKRRLDKRPVTAFRYRNKGSLAVIGRNAAVADFGRIRVWGYPAWLTWVFVHIWYLIEFDNKLIVMIQWAFDYVTRKRGARLITGKDPQPLIKTDEQK